MLSTWNYQNIFNQLYCNLKKLKKNFNDNKLGNFQMRGTNHKYRSSSFSNRRLGNVDKLSHWEDLENLFSIFCEKYLEILENYQRSGDFWGMNRIRQENQKGIGLRTFIDWRSSNYSLWIRSGMLLVFVN